jgi:hypothetical protein
MFNLTLWIQGLNFLIAYLFLARFFFKPVLHVIENQTQSEEALHQSIERCRIVLKEAYLKKKQLWQEACGKFHQYIDFGDYIEFKPKACDLQPLNDNLEIVVDVKEQDQLTQILVDKIIDMQ